MYFIVFNFGLLADVVNPHYLSNAAGGYAPLRSPRFSSSTGSFLAKANAHACALRKLLLGVDVHKRR